MGYECKTACQVEVSPGIFKFIIEGQTETERGVPIDYVKPISRKFFKLTGEDVKRDLKDKVKIKRALDARKIRYPVGASTSDIAKLLAEDNARRGIMNLESLEIVSAATHFADKKIIDAKDRIDELYGFTAHSARPYDDTTSLDELTDIIVKKEAEMGGGGPSGDDVEVAELNAWLNENAGEDETITKRSKLLGVRKLRAMKESRLVDIAAGLESDSAT
jgi:hypothetical protein